MQTHDLVEVNGKPLNSNLLNLQPRNLTTWPILQVAVNNEIMAAISNQNYANPGGMLTTWGEGVNRCGVKNAMVVSLDAATTTYAQQMGLFAFEMHVKVGLLRLKTGLG